MEALNTFADARAPVAPPASGVVADAPNQRQRFFVELAPAETTIVSWKTLVQEANNGVVADDSSNEKEELVRIFTFLCIFCGLILLIYVN